MPDALRLARAVRELLATPDRWTQGAGARTKTGRIIGPQCAGAVCWCLSGAIDRESGFYEELEFTDELSTACGGNFIDWNDTPGRTHADVLALLDRVIAEMEAEGG